MHVVIVACNLSRVERLLFFLNYSMNVITELPWVVIIKILNEYYLMFITVSLHYHCLFFSVYRFPSNLFSISIHCNLGFLCHNASDFSLLLNPWDPVELRGFNKYRRPTNCVGYFAQSSRLLFSPKKKQ